MTVATQTTAENEPHQRSAARSATDFEIRFPALNDPAQDQECFEATINGTRRRMRIHDYDALYDVPGLYEALVYDALRCTSPQRVVELLCSVLIDWPRNPSDLRVLDLGAGNGIVAEELRRVGVPHIVGLDLLPEAALAAGRDRPGAYDDYVVADLTELNAAQDASVRAHKCNSLVTVAALGFGDIPPRAFANALNFTSDNGWLAMTIKEDFLHPSDDDSGFARLVQMMIADRVITMEAHLRYCHRVSITGERLFYVAAIARKCSDVPEDMITAADRSRATADPQTIGGDHTSVLLGQDGPLHD